MSLPPRDKSSARGLLRNAGTQARVWASFIVSYITTQGSPQVPLVQRNQEIQALSSYRPDQPFAMRIRLRRPNWRAQHSQPKGELQFLVPLYGRLCP